LSRNFVKKKYKKDKPLPHFRVLCFNCKRLVKLQESGLFWDRQALDTDLDTAK
jgi:hypothetical protein